MCEVGVSVNPLVSVVSDWEETRVCDMVVIHGQ